MTGLASGVAYVLLSAVVGGVGLPFGIPPEPEDPVMGRIAPEHCMFYATWSGTASPDLKSPNQTEQLLAEPEVQYFLTQIGSFYKTGVEKALQEDGVIKAMQDDKENDPEDEKNSEDSEWRKDFFDIFGQAIYRPGAVYFAIHPADPNAEAKTLASEEEKEQAETTKNAIGKMLKGLPQKVGGDKIDADNFDLAFVKRLEGGMVLSLGPDSSPLQQRMKAFAEKQVQEINDASNDKAQDGEKAEEKGKAEFISKNDTDWYACFEFKDYVFFIGCHEHYLIVAMGMDSYERTVARLEPSQSPPQWWSNIQEQLPTERRSSITYVNFDALDELIQIKAPAEKLAKYTKMRDAFKTLGLGNAKGWIQVTGLDGSDFASKSLLLLDGEPQGILGMISNQPLQLDDLNPIPADVFAAGAFRFDLQKVSETVCEALEKLDPETQATAKSLLEEVKKNLPIELKQEDLKSLGNATWCIYGSVDEGMWPMLVVSLHDWAEMNTAYEQWMEALKKAAPPRATSETAEIEPFKNPQLEQFRFADTDVYCLNVGVVPSWCLTKQALVVGVSPQSVKAYLARDERYEPLSRQLRVAELFAKGQAPMALVFCDSRPCIKYLYNYSCLFSPALIQALRQAGIQTDLSLIPSPPSIYRHLRPSLTTLSRNQYGIEWTTHDVWPFAPVNTGLSLILLMGVSDVLEEKKEEPVINVPLGDSETGSGAGSAETPAKDTETSTPVTSDSTEETPRILIKPGKEGVIKELLDNIANTPSQSGMPIAVVPANVAQEEKKAEEKKAENAKTDSPEPDTDPKPTDQKPKD